MSTIKAGVKPVRQFEETRGCGRSRRHVLAICDTGQVRVLIDRGERMAIRLLAILNDGQEHECIDGPPQIAALCDEYVREYLRRGGPLACRLTREHLASSRPDQAAVGFHADGSGPQTHAPPMVDSDFQPATASRGTRCSTPSSTGDALEFAA